MKSFDETLSEGRKPVKTPAPPRPSPTHEGMIEMEATYGVELRHGKSAPSTVDAIILKHSNQIANELKSVDIHGFISIQINAAGGSNSLSFDF